MQVEDEMGLVINLYSIAEIEPISRFGAFFRELRQISLFPGLKLLPVLDF